MFKVVSSPVEGKTILEGNFILRSLKGVMDQLRLLQRVPDVLEHVLVFAFLSPLKCSPRYHNVNVVFFPVEGNTILEGIFILRSL